MELKFPIDLKCHFAKVNQGLLENCKPFTCGESDLDEFFTRIPLPMKKI